MDGLEIGFCGEVVVAARGDSCPSGGHLVGHLGLQKVAGHGVAVEGHRHRTATDGMDVLCHAAVAYLDALAGCYLPIGAETGLQMGVGLHDMPAAGVVGLGDVARIVEMVIGGSAENAVKMEAQTRRQLQVIGDLPFLMQPDGVAPCISLLSLMQQVDVPFGRLQLQVSGLKAIFEGHTLSGHPALVVMQREMPDEAFHRVVDVEHVDAHVAAEVAEGELGIGVMVVVERMQPTRIGGGVAPVHVHQVFHSHVVPASEEGQRQTVAL